MSRPTTHAALLVDVAVLRRERNRLRDQVTRRHAERRRMAVNRLVDRAHLDALALLTVAVGGGHTGRAYAALPRRRWSYAAALLRMARLARAGRDLRLELPATPDEAIKRLELATAAARTMPSRYARHVPPSLRPALLSRELHRL